MHWLAAYLALHAPLALAALAPPAALKHAHPGHMPCLVQQRARRVRLAAVVPAPVPVLLLARRAPIRPHLL
jgi:hypothetical protein